MMQEVRRSHQFARICRRRISINCHHATRKKCGTSVINFFLTLQGLAASVYYSAEEIEVLEDMARPGRPRKGVVKDNTLRKERMKQLRGLKQELKENSGTMTSMFNSLL
ncbi:uncharacterized protein LOC127287819 [Leptopilina boulardi]|uniref:uncharacterized protein LOC127287819 n=1 Tax=Leptopilina boulardi TaxID=63433 RepID=UPI0021F597DB|nr:uncharacterized protein LOC127287819 [Leptopilina boulardi]